MGRWENVKCFTWLSLLQVDSYGCLFEDINECCILVTLFGLVIPNGIDSGSHNEKMSYYVKWPNLNTVLILICFI